MHLLVLSQAVLMESGCQRCAWTAASSCSAR